MPGTVGPKAGPPWRSGDSVAGQRSSQTCFDQLWKGKTVIKTLMLELIRHAKTLHTTQVRGSL